MRTLRQTQPKRWWRGIIAAALLGAVFTHSSVATAKPKKKPLLFMDLSMGVAETYDTNVYQTTFNAEDDFVTQFSPAIAVDLGLVRWLKLGVTYSPTYKYFANHSDLNELLHRFTFDVGVDLAQEQHFRNFRIGTEISYTPVSISVTRSATSSENTSQRLILAVIPGYLWEISPLWDVDFELRAQRQMFFGDGADSSSGDLGVTVRRRILRRIYLRGGGNYTFQHFDEFGNTQIYGASGGVDVEFFKRLNGGVSVGYQIIDLPSNSNGVGYGNALTLNANLDYALSKRTSFVLEGVRANTVDLNNNPFLSLRASFAIKHRLSSKSLLSLTTYYQKADQDLPTSDGVFSNTLQTVGGSLRFQYTEHWTFAANMTRDKNRGAYYSDDYTQNRYTLDVRYHFPIRIK